MIYQALRTHERIVLSHFKDCEKSTKLKPDNGNSTRYSFTGNKMILIRYLNKFIHCHTYQIITYVDG